MKVRLIRNNIKNVKEFSYLEPHLKSEKPYEYVSLNKEYIVYAISEIDDFTWYCLCDDQYSSYPRWYPFPLFEITDNRLSRFWVFGFEEREKKKEFIISFPEWVNNLYFYGELVDGGNEDESIKLFKKYKELIDLEFQAKNISEVAQLGDKDWLICPICIDAWECSTERDGMVRCPKCNTIMQNPRYKS